MCQFCTAYKKGANRPRHTDKTGPAFDIQIVRRGISSEVLKRRHLMSNEKAIYSHQLVVRFDQDADNVVSWIVQTDDAVANTCHASYDELAGAGAPLAALGIRALFDLLGEDMINLVLDKANGYLWKECYRLQGQQCLPGSDDIDGTVVGDSEEGVVVH